MSSQREESKRKLTASKMIDINPNTCDNNRLLLNPRFTDNNMLQKTLSNVQIYPRFIENNMP